MKFNLSCANEYQPPRTELKNKENTLCKKPLPPPLLLPIFRSQQKITFTVNY